MYIIKKSLRKRLRITVCTALLAFLTVDLGTAFPNTQTTAQTTAQTATAPATQENSEPAETPSMYQIPEAEWKQMQEDLANLKLQMAENAEIAEKTAKEKTKKEKEDWTKPQTKLQGRLYFDTMSVDSDGTAGREDFSGTACATARLGIKGMHFGMIEYEALFDFSEGDVTAKNVYAGFRNLPSGIGMRFGHFKEPWSLENLTSSRHGLTMERSLLNRTKDLCGGRNYGVMFHNWDAEQPITWAAGIFAASMPESLDAVLGDEDHLAFTGRLTYLPIYEKCPDGHLSLWHLGAAVSVREYDTSKASEYKTRLKVTPGNDSCTISNTTFTGLESLTGVQFESAMVRGRFCLDFEQAFFFMDDQFAGEAEMHSGYVGASWFLTGESRNYDRKVGRYVAMEPKNPFIRTCRDGVGVFSGPGAWELTYRYSWLDAEELACENYGFELGETTAHSVGLNWYLSSKCRILFNYVCADTEHASGKSGRENIFQTRFQFDF